MQNVAIDIYENYFATEEGETARADEASNEAPSAKTLAAFKDPSEIKRTACQISWFPDGGKRFAVAFSIMQFQDWRIDKASHASYIWDVNNPNEPEMALNPVHSLCCIDAYNVKQQDSLVGGLYNGLVSFWDTRQGSQPVQTSVIETSHRNPVYDICWLTSKTGTECCSTSTDGQVLWWDAKKLAEPLEKLLLEDKQHDGRAIGGVRLECAHPARGGRGRGGRVGGAARRRGSVTRARGPVTQLPLCGRHTDVCALVMQVLDRWRQVHGCHGAGDHHIVQSQGEEPLGPRGHEL
jgi:dynein intermediate chain 2